MREWIRGVVAIAIPTVVVAAHGSSYGRWIVDDAAITFAYARSIATGEGPVLQSGAAPVEGYSNPAWLAILAVGRLLGLFDRGAWLGVPDYVTFPKAVALACCVGMFAACWWAARAMCARPALVTAVACSITAAVPSFAIWVFSGLENPLLGLAVVVLGAVLARAAVAGTLLAPRVAVACGLLAALAALTRPDGLVYAAAHPLAALVLLRRDTLAASARAAAVSVAAFAVPVGAYFAWRWSTFGALLPNTALAKTQGVPTVADLAKPGELVGYAGVLLAIGAIVCVGAVLVRPSPLRTGVIALLVPLALAIAAFAVLKADWMGQLRFATPVWPLAALVGVLAAVDVVPRLAPRGRATLAVATAVAVALSVASWWQGAAQFRQQPTLGMCAVAQVSGEEINGYAKLLDVEDGSLLAADIGGTALTSDLRIHDMVGLADRPIAERWAAGDMPGLRDHVFEDVRPTFIHAHSAWNAITGIGADPRIEADYELVAHLPGPGWVWVRRDAVPSRAALAEAREWSGVARAEHDRVARAPLGSCGDTLGG